MVVYGYGIFSSRSTALPFERLKSHLYIEFGKNGALYYTRKAIGTLAVLDCDKKRRKSDRLYICIV